MKTTKQYILAFVFSTVLVGCKKADMISPKPASSPVVQSLSSSSEASTLSDQDERMKTWIEAEKSKLKEWYKAGDKWYFSLVDIFLTYEKKHLRSDQYQARLAYINQRVGLSTSPYSYKYQDPSTGLLSFEQYMVKLNGTLSGVQSYINCIPQAEPGTYHMDNLRLHEKFVLELQKLVDILKSVRTWSDLDLPTLDQFKRNHGLSLFLRSEVFIIGDGLGKVDVRYNGPGFLTGEVSSNSPESEHGHFWQITLPVTTPAVGYRIAAANGTELPIHEQRMDYVQWKGDFDRRFDAFKKLNPSPTT